MVYKRYLKKRVNGAVKTFGPYYYESYRDANGKTHSKYLPDYKPPRSFGAVTSKKTLFFILFFAFLMIVLYVGILSNLSSENSGADNKEDSKITGFVSRVSHFFTFFSVEEQENQLEESETEQEEIPEEVEQEIAVEDIETEEEIEPETEIDNEGIEESENLTEISEEEIIENDSNEEIIENNTQQNLTIESPTLNITLNETELSPSNQTQESDELLINLSQQNLTIENFTVNETVVNITINETNLTILNQTFEMNESLINFTQENLTINETLVQYSAVIGKPVRWEKIIRFESFDNASVDNLTLEVPGLAENISIKKRDIKTGVEESIEEKKVIEEVGQSFFMSLIRVLFSITGRVADINEDEEEIRIEINENLEEEDELVVEYYTEAPYSEEVELGNKKVVTIIGPEEVHYENVLAFTELKKEADNLAVIKLYRTTGGAREEINFSAYDFNNNSKIDNIEWIVPSLSNQTYEIIFITKALHLDENRSIIEEVYDSVAKKDGNYTQLIPDKNYIRVYFERNLSNRNDITVYARANETSRLEIYKENSDQLIASIENIQEENWYKTYLTNLSEEFDVFDLRIVGGMEFDYIVDPSNNLPIVNSVILNSTNVSSNDTNQNLTASWNVSDSDGNSVYNITDWRINGSSFAVLNMPFENHTNSSNRAIDYSTYQNNGTVFGAVFNSTGGHDGYGAYTFDGDDYIGVISVGALKQFSVSGWFKQSTVGNQKWIGIMESDNDSTATLIGSGNSGTDAEYDFCVNGICLNRIEVTGSDWHFYVLVYNGTRGLLYKDGIYKGMTEVTSFNYTSAKVHIGKRAWAESGYFIGAIDHVQIWNTSLSTEQIFALYQNRTDLIVSQETLTGENWSICLTPNDGIGDGSTVCSINMTINSQNKPEVSSLNLNSTNSATNNTNQNLTASWTVSDADGNSVYNITDWRINGSSIAVVNMPFEEWEENKTIDENDWTKDYSTYQNNGTVVGATFNSTGGHDGGGAYEFDGLNDAIRINNSSLSHGWTELSISAWIYIKNWTDYKGVSYSSGSDDNHTIGLYIRSPSDSNAGFFVSNGSNSNAAVSSAINLSQWYHLVGTWKSGEAPTIYVNGTNYTSLTTGVLYGEINQTDYFYIGVDSWSPSTRTFNGTIDDVKIFNKKLSAEQVMAIYQNRTDLIVSQETTAGENWSICLTPNDGIEDGATNCSQNITITAANSIPVISSVILNSTNVSSNDTNQNLTGYVTATDSDGDNITYAYNWYKNNTLNATTLITDGLVSYYPLDNDVLDYYGSNNGTNSGAVLNTSGGKMKGAYGFNGDTSYISIADNDTLDINSSITISVWIKLNNTIAGHSDDRLYSLYKSGAWSMWFKNGASTSCSPCDCSDGQLWFDLWGWNGVATTGISWNTNTWYHIVGTYNGSSAKIYVNGQLNNSCAFTKSILTSSNALTIGGDTTASSLNGSIDEVMIFNRSLNESEIQQLYYGSVYGGNIMHSERTTAGDNWSLGIKAGDYIGWSNETNSSNILIKGPEVILNSPLDSQILYSSNVTFNISAIDDIDLDNCTLYTNVSGWQSNETKTFSGLLDNDIWNLNIGGGNYIWNAYCCDNESNCYFSQNNHSFTIFPPPNILSVKLNSTNPATNDTNQNLTGYVTATDSNNDNITYAYNWYKNNTLNATTLITDGLVSYYPLDNDVLDYYGSNNGTNNGASLNTSGGKMKGAYGFNGDTSYISIADNDTLDINSSITISVWIKLNNSIAGHSEDRLYSLYKSGAWSMWFKNGASTSCSPCDCSDGQLWFDLWGWNGVATTGISWNTNTWYHIVGTYNGSSAKIYVNGQLNNSCAFTKSILTSSNALTIGGDTTASNLNGSIDEVMIFNRSLNESEIQQLYYGSVYGGNIMHSERTTAGDNWSLGIKAGDYTGWSNETNSSGIFITEANFVPVVNSLILNSTNPTTNDSNQNLTAYWNVSDADNDSIYNIIDWRVNGSSIAVLNMPFESHSNNSNRAIDYSTYQNNGTVFGAVFNSTGGHDGGGAYTFDGVDDYINLGTNGYLNGSFSISVHFKLDSLDNSQMLIEKRDGGTTDLNYWLVFRDGENRLRAGFGNGTDYFWVDCSYDMNYNWSFVTFNWNNSTKNLSLFLNGDHMNSSVSSSTPSFSGDQELLIGRSSDSILSYRYLNGSIDDVKIYNRSLSAEQIKALYQNRTDLIVSQETSTGENWSICLTPNDGTEDGATNCSGNITITRANSIPVITSVILNSTNVSSNDTNQNLTCYATATDNDGDNLTYSGEWYRNGSIFIGEYWNKTYDNGSIDKAYGIAVDSSDNVYVTGSSYDGTRYSYNYYTIKYDSSGNHLWNKTYDSRLSDLAYGIAVDSSSNVYVTGSRNANYYTIKYDSSGNHLWNKTYDGGSLEIAYGIAVDSSDNVYVTGESNDNYYTIKYDSSGNHLWNKTYDSGNDDVAYAVAVDSSDNVYVTGESNNGYYTIKYDSSGNHLWNKTYDEGIGMAYGIAVDSSDNVYVTGRSITVMSNGNYYTIKYDSSGNHLWNKTYDSGNDDGAYGIAVDSSDNVYVTGESNDDYYTIKYDSSGNYLWNKTYDGGSYDDARGVAVDSSGNVYVAGYSNETSYDYYVIKYKDGFILSNQTQGQQKLVATMESDFTTAGDIWNCSVKAFDGTNYSSISYSINLSISNTAPNTTLVILNSSSGENFTNDNLICYANISDLDGSSVYANYTWYNNSVLFISGQTGGITQGSLTLISTLLEGNTSAGENWTCSVLGYDGTDYEEGWNNATIEIRDNILPIIQINYPLNTTYNINISSLNYTINESFLDTCWYSLDEGITNSSSISAGENFTNLSSIEGRNNWSVFCRDDYGNKNSSVVYFFKDTIYPQIGYTTGTSENNTNSKHTWIFVNLSINETNPNIVSFNLFYNNHTLYNQTNLSSSSREINWTGLALGTYYYNASIEDIAGNVNSTETRMIRLYEETPSTGTTTGTGGGGGSSGSSFEVDKDFVKVIVKQGETEKETIEIENTGGREMDIDIEIENISRFLIISEDSFKLLSGQSKQLNLNFYAKEQEIPEVYMGRIKIKSGNIEKIVNVIIEVKEKRPLFDIITDIKNRLVSPGDFVNFNIDMFNMGDLEHIDVLLYYSLMDLEGNTLSSKEESLAIEKELNVSKSLFVPYYTPEGRYIVYSRVAYENITATSTDMFEVKKWAFPSFRKVFFTWIIPILIICLIVKLIMFLSKKLRKKKSESYGSGN